MRHQHFPALLGTLVITGLLSACQIGGVKEDDQTGDLGAVQQASPADIYVKLGVEYMRAGQPTIALRSLKRGLAADPKNAQVHHMIALLYQQLGEYKIAARHFEQAARFAPKDPDIRHNWGRFLCLQNKYQDADKQFNLALKNPLYGKPWKTLTAAGYCRRRAGDISGAEAYLREALSVNGKFAPALTQLAELSYEQGNYTDARAYLERYQRSAIHSATTLLLAVRVERKLGASKNAKKYERLLRKNFPDAPEIVQLNQ